MYSFSLSAQNKLNQKITYQSQEKHIVEILEDLSAEIGIIFSYSRNIFPSDLKLKVEARNESAKDLLTRVLGHHYEFEKIGVYLVIYKRKKPLTTEPPKKKESLEPLTVKPATVITNPVEATIEPSPKADSALIKIDTVVQTFTLYDTAQIVVYDTTELIVYDTIIITDTVTQKVIQARKAKAVKETPKVTLDFLGFSALSFQKALNLSNSEQELFDSYENVRNSIARIGFNLRANYTFKNYSLSTGIIYGSIAENISFQNDSSGQMQRIDTIATFFEIIDGRRVPIYVTDTVMVAFTTRQDVAFINQRSVIEIPLVVGWTWPFKKVTISLQAGVSATIPLKTTIKIPIKNEVSFKVINTRIKSYYINYRMSASIALRVNNNLTVLCSPFYTQSIKNYLKDESPLPLKREAAGIAFGLRLSF